MLNNQLKICLISSHGGHFHELNAAVKDLTGSLYWVTFRTRRTQQALKDGIHYFVIDPNVNKWKYFINGFQSLGHLFKEHPDVIISTGAGIAIPTMLIGKFLLRAKIIYIESAAAVVRPSKTGKFMYKYSDLFIVQWDSLIKYYPKAIFSGLL